jgi:hypothetical protein
LVVTENDFETRLIQLRSILEQTAQIFPQDVEFLKDSIMLVVNKCDKNGGKDESIFKKYLIQLE